MTFATTLEEVLTLRSENAALRAELEKAKRIEAAARYYYDHYMQDEAAEDDLVCTMEQHLAAKAVRDALGGGH